MKRDFSVGAYNQILWLISKIESGPGSGITNWYGDNWNAYESWIDSLGIRTYISNVNSYHNTVVARNIAAKKAVDTVFHAVGSVDVAYEGVFSGITSSLSQWSEYINQLAQIANLGNNGFSSDKMSSALDGLLGSIAKGYSDRLGNKFVVEIDGEYVFNEQLLIEYIKKNPADMTQEEIQAVIDALALLNDSVVMYDSAITIGNGDTAVDLGNGFLFASENGVQGEYSAARIRNGNTYASILNTMVSMDKDGSTLGSSLLKICAGDTTVNLFGAEVSVDYEKLTSKSVSFSTYLAFWETEGFKQYALKTETEAKIEFKSGFDEDKDIIEKTKIKDESYFDEFGNEISADDAPKYYEEEATIAELGTSASASVSLYEADWKGENGSAYIDVCKAEAHASAAAGLYVVGADGERKFSPGVKAEVGASFTTFEAGAEGQIGNDYLGINGEATATVGRVGAQGEVGVNFLNQDGELDVQIGASARAEAIAGEIKGSAGVNVLGGEVGVQGSLNYGIGAHADVGIIDGVVKFDVGVTFGVGFSVGVEVDVGGMIDGISKGAEAAWDGVCDGAEAVGDFFVDLFSW